MSEIFTLSIKCVTGSYLKGPWQFVMAAPVDMTLGDLADHILATADFDGDHLDEFYLANGLRGKITWLTPDGEWDDDADAMDLQLSDIFPLPKNKKLYYLYDHGAAWRFQISKQGKSTTAQPDIEYPCIVSETGVKPEEYGDDEEEEEEEEED
jgi:hypothetical protein